MTSSSREEVRQLCVFATFGSNLNPKKMADIRFDSQEDSGGDLAVNLDHVSRIESTTNSNDDPIILFIMANPYAQPQNVEWVYTGANATTNRDEAYTALQTSDMTERT